MDGTCLRDTQCPNSREPSMLPRNLQTLSSKPPTRSWKADTQNHSFEPSAPVLEHPTQDLNPGLKVRPWALHLTPKTRTAYTLVPWVSPVAVAVFKGFYFRAFYSFYYASYSEGELLHLRPAPFFGHLTSYYVL